MNINTVKNPVLVHPTAVHAEIARKSCDFSWCDHAACAPADVAPLAGYAVVITFSRDARDGVQWEGDLYRAGEKVLVVGNDGQGGPNWYEGTASEITALKAAAREAFPTVQYEHEDIAVGFLDLVQQVGAL